MQKSSLNTKLEDSWAGPYTVLKNNSPLSYRVTTGDRVLPSVHVQLLKTYTPREPENTDCQAVLEPDTVVDSMDDQYAEAEVTTGEVDNDSKEADIGRWESDLADILTKVTELHPPICQGPYNTPQALLGNVEGTSMAKRTRIHQRKH